MQDRFKLRRIDIKSEIHPTAIIHPWAKIGQAVRIGPFCVIGEHVELGDGCVLGPNVQIDGRTTIGNKNRFFHGATIGTEPQDLKYEGRKTFVEIGDENTFREFVTVHRGSDEGGTTRVKSHCYIMAYAHVGHDCKVGEEVILANSVQLAGHVRVDDFASIGGMSAVHQFGAVGKYAFVGGGSRIEMDVPPFVRAAGSPLRVYGVNSIGLERRGFSAEKRTLIKKMYNVMYRNDLNVSQVIEHLKNGDFADPERTILVDFLVNSQRGISK
jgi:UDP-N-acetylglucosamine acyltransferase